MNDCIVPSIVGPYWYWDYRAFAAHCRGAHSRATRTLAAGGESSVNSTLIAATAMIPLQRSLFAVPVVFLSSTFQDLVYERRFVARELRRMGLRVVAMEDDCPEHFDWTLWSMNQARRCDVYLGLFGDRVGSEGSHILRFYFKSITHVEREFARYRGNLDLCYQLKRPFSDASRLWVSESERRHYEQTLEVADSFNNATDKMVADFQQGLLDAAPVNSVAELAQRIALDVPVSKWYWAWQRMRRWRRCYFDTQSASSRWVYEDEHAIGGTDRVGLGKRLKRPALVLALAIAAAGWYSSSAPFALTLATGAAVVCGIVALAAAPSFVNVGTKTISARGLFGLRAAQQLTTRPFVVQHGWGWINDWFGVSTIAIRFEDGRRFFVPFITSWNNVTEDVAKRKPYRPRKKPEPSNTTPEEIFARMQAFAEKIRKDGFDPPIRP